MIVDYGIGNLASLKNMFNYLGLKVCISRNKEKIINEEVYNNHLLENDKNFVIKKLGFNKDSFSKYINQNPESHYGYKSDENLIKNLLFFKKIILNLKNIFQLKSLIFAFSKKYN